MANAVYPVYKQNLLAGTAGYDLDNDTVNDGPYCALVETGYTYSAAHDFHDDITAANISGTDQRITGPTVTNGVFSGTDLTYTAVAYGGADVDTLIIYRHNSGANTTWPLVLFLDAGVTGLPVTPNGGNITVTWADSPATNNIFALSDERAKTDIRIVGGIGPLSVCEFRYRGERDVCVGLMAQDVERYVPDAVIEVGNLKRVNYARAVEWAMAA